MIELDTQTIRAQILQQLGYRCEALLVLLPAGSESEPSIYWARQNLSPTELPACVITPQPESGDRDSYGADSLVLPVTVSLACLLGSHNALDLSENLLAELRRLPASDPTLGSVADDTRYIEGGVDDYPERDDQALIVSATFEIDYTTEPNNPDASV